MKEALSPVWEAAPLLCSLVLRGMHGSAWKSWDAWVPLGKVALSFAPHGKRYSSSFLQGTRPRFASGTLMSLSDDTAFPCWGTVRVWPRFPDAPSGCQPGRSPQRSKEEAERPGDGCPCVGAEEICGAPPLLSEGRNEDERRPSSNTMYLNEKCSFRIFKI